MRKFVFRWRGGLMALWVVIVLCVAKPSPGWLWLGAALALTGELVRLWALGYVGLPTRRSYLDAPDLVTAGPYAHVRNPLYLGNFLGGMGVALAASGGMPEWARAVTWVLALGALSFLYGMIIPLEEEFLAKQYGGRYEDYRRQVPALLPKLVGAGRGQGEFSMTTALRYEWSTLSWLVVIWSVLLYKLQSVML